MKIRINGLKSLTFLSIFVFTFYTMFYQHAIGIIDGLLPFLYVLMLFLSLLYTTKDARKTKKISWIIRYVVFAYISGAFFLFPEGKELFNELIVRIVCYMIVMYCVYCFIDKDRNNLSKIMLILWISALMLAVSTFFVGDNNSTYYGGTSIGELNKNMLSCYITLGFLANLYFLVNIKARWEKTLICCSIIIEILVQFNTASRTGVISILILLIAYFHTVYSIKYERKWAHRIVLILIISVGLLEFALEFTKLSEMFVVIERFQGKYIVGDSVRKYVQSVAWDTFLSSPVFGKGFGCVSVQCGTYSHSLYFEALASIGIVGLIALIVPIIKYMVLYYKMSCVSSESLENRLLSRLMSWSVLLVLITGISQIYVYYFLFYVYIALWISVHEVISTNNNLNKKIIRI